MPQSDPWLDSFVQNFQRLQQQPQPEGVFSRYVKPAVMAPLHVLGAGYRAIGNVATGIEGLVEDGDALSKFRLSPAQQQQGMLEDVGGAFGVPGTAGVEAHDPYDALANVVVHAAGGERSSDVDPQWEAAFRRANPTATAAEAGTDLGGRFVAQALLDPVLHGLGALAARAGAGVLTAGAARPTYNVLPEMVQKAFPTIGRAFEGGVPNALLAQTPERAGQIAHGLGAAFVPGMLVSGAERLSEAPKAIGEAREQGAPLGGLVSPQAVETLGQGAVDTAFGLMGGMHAFARRRGIEAAADTLGEKPPAADAGLETPPPPPPPPPPPSGPPRAAYEPPAITRREDLLGLTPEQQKAFEEATSGIEPTPEMRMALEGKAPEPPAPAAEPTSAIEAAYQRHLAQAAGLSPDEFLDVPPDLQIKPTYEDVLRRIQGELGAQGHETLPPVPDLGVPLPPGATEALRASAPEVAAADLRGRERAAAERRGFPGSGAEQTAARLLYQEAESAANEMNSRLEPQLGGSNIDRGTATPEREITPEDVLSGRAPLQVYGVKGQGGGTAQRGGVDVETPEGKRGILMALAARVARRHQDLTGEVKQSLVEGIDSGRLVEMLQGKQEAMGFRPQRPVLTPDREIAEHDMAAEEAGFPDDKVTPTRQVDPLAGAAERMAALRARKAAEAAAPVAEAEDPFERRLREAAQRAAARPAPETTTAEQPVVKREPQPETPAEPAAGEPTPTVEPVLYTDKEGKPIDGDYFLSPEQAKKATEMGLTQETAELLSEDMDTFGAELEKMDARIRPHMLGLYRKFHATNLAPRAGEGVHAVLRGDERPAEPALLVDRDTPVEKRYTTVAAPRREAPQPYTQKSELPPDFGVPKGPSLLEKMAARAKAAGQGEGGEGGERHSAAAAPAASPVEFAALRSRLQSLMGSAIRRVDEVPSGSPERAGRAGIDIEWHNRMRTRILETGEIIPDIRDVERGRPEVDPRSQVIRAAYTPERAAARAAGGEGRGTLGEGQGIPAGAVIRLAEGKWSLTDANAELLHDAWARLLRGSERRLLTDRYARELEGRLRAAGKEVTPEALEEEAVHKWAEEVTKWQERAIAEGAIPKASPGWFKRLWEWVTRMAGALRAPEFERLTREAAEGGLWERGKWERRVGEGLDALRGAAAAPAAERFASADVAGASPAEIAEARKAWKEKGTESPWFRRWFGASKIVDESGKPKTLYHGTASNFTEFDPGKADPNALYGPGFYLTDSPRVAGGDVRDDGTRTLGYAQRRTGKREAAREAEGASVMPVYAAVKNPLDMSAPVPRDLVDSFVEAAESSYSGWDYPTTAEGKPAFRDADDFYHTLVSAVGNKSEANDWLDANGYDGIVHEGGKITGGERHEVVIAFHPEQIKSATGNRGTFSGETGDIRYSAGPRGESAPEGSRFAAGPRDIPPFTEADKAVADAEAAREKARVAARELRTPPIRAAEREAARAGREVRKAEKVRTEAALREHIGEAARKPGEGPEIIGLSGDKHEDGTPMEAGDLTRGGPGIEPRMMTAEEAAKLKPTQVARKVAEYEEGKEKGFAIRDLARDVPDTLEKAGPRVRTLLETKPDSFFVDEAIKARKMGHVLGGDLRTALEVVVEGRKVAMQNAVKALEAAKAEGPGSEEAVAKEKYKFFVSTLEHMHAAAARAFYEGREAAVNDATEAGRTLQAAARVVAGTKSINDAMIDAIMKETRGKVDPRALAHLKEVLADPKGKGEFLDEALRGIFKPTLLDKIIEGWKAGLVSAPGTLLGANPLGNAGEMLARMAESRTAPAVDAMAHRLGLVKERTRFVGEAEMESHGMRQAYAGAGVQFGREAGQFKDLAEGLRDTWKGIEPPPKAGQKYESQVRAIGRGPEWMVKALDPVHRALFGTRFDLGARIRLPLSILQVTDDFFYRLATGAELGKLSYREARAQLGAKASEREIIARAKELHAEASDKGGPLYRKALELAKSRVFHPSDLSDPSHLARTAKHVRAQFKLSHFVIPFVDTPMAIARLAIERSPLGFFKASRRWDEMQKAVKAGKPPAEIAKLRDEALDLSTRASLGTALTVAFYMLAQSGILTGKGPTDPKKRAVLLDSGWQPYSVAIPMSNGKTAYIPYNRFEPLSSLLGVFADLHETPKGEKNVIKGMGIALSNITSKTFLSGLSEFFGALDKPEEALPGYAANLAGSFVPNVVAKGAQATDPVVRETKPPEGGLSGRIAATIESRIPGVSTTLPARYGPTGRVAERPGNAVSRFLSPVQISTTSPERAVEAELARISYAPPTPDREVRVGSQKVPITVAEQERLVGEYQRATERVSRLLKSPAYRAAPDDGPQGKQTKRTMIRAIYLQAERKWRDRHAGILLGRARAAEAGA